MRYPDDDIETALREDRAGVYKQTLIEDLKAHDAALKNELHRGVSPDDYRRLDALRGATEAASQVVEAIWRQLHRR